ncbi:MAG: VWA domain-containing protein, partial [Spirochaetia bacterium]|nr:VWA domain-containing protein [Spirochaetia bacterium]
LETDTIGGFNSMLKKQKDQEGACFITTVLFDNTYTLLHDRIDIRAVEAIGAKEYFVGGSTALLDAIGKTINKIENVQQNSTSQFQAEQVLFVIITDGQENSSREFSAETIKEMIESKQKTNWEFIFLGANIDAIESATQFGIAPEHAQNFHADAEGIQVNFESVCEAVSQIRATKVFPKQWNKKIQHDFEKRKQH